MKITSINRLIITKSIARVTRFSIERASELRDRPLNRLNASYDFTRLEDYEIRSIYIIDIIDYIRALVRSRNAPIRSFIASKGVGPSSWSDEPGTAIVGSLSPKKSLAVAIACGRSLCSATSPPIINLDRRQKIRDIKLRICEKNT